MRPLIARRQKTLAKGLMIGADPFRLGNLRHIDFARACAVRHDRQRIKVPVLIGAAGCVIFDMMPFDQGEHLIISHELGVLVRNLEQFAERSGKLRGECRFFAAHDSHDVMLG